MKNVSNKIILILTILIQAQLGLFATDTKFNIYYIGHSLLSDIPSMTEAIINNIEPNSFYFRVQNIPGAPLAYHWNNSDTVKIPDDEPSRQLHYSKAFPSGEFSHVIVTDSVPRGRNSQDSNDPDYMENESVEYIGKILEAARAGRKDVKLYYYETWHHITSGLEGHDPWHEDNFDNKIIKWRERINADAPMWDRIVERVNREHPPQKGQYPVVLIPAGRILGLIVDEIEAGNIPGFTKLSDLFLDEIHTNFYGKYLVAAIHASILTGLDPKTFIMDIISIHGGQYFNKEVIAGWNPDGTPIKATYMEFSKPVHRKFMEVIEKGIKQYYKKS